MHSEMLARLVRDHKVQGGHLLVICDPAVVTLPIPASLKPSDLREPTLKRPMQLTRLHLRRVVDEIEES